MYIKSFSLCTLLLFFFVSSFQFSYPNDEENQNKTEKVSARIIDGWSNANGEVIGGIEIKLAKGWKTYWRNPGNFGVIPQFDWSQSANLASIELLWPKPQKILSVDNTSFGYSEQVIIPFIATPKQQNAENSLVLNLSIGICKNLCSLKHFQLRKVINGTGTSDEKDRILDFASSSPVLAPVNLTDSVSCTLERTDKGLLLKYKIKFKASTSNQEFGILEYNSSKMWIMDQTSETNNSELTLNANLKHFSDSFLAFERSLVTLTTVGSKESFEFKGCPS